ncbi:MAG: hypothetical protein RLZZ129_2055 [Verrucomicrobiota bacterium]|jgi:hypothetical protein
MKKPAAKKTTLPDPALLPVMPFPVSAINAPAYPHAFGPVQTPEEMAQHVPPKGRWREVTVEAAATKALAALVGSGPKQEPPHSGTAQHLREGLARLRDHALAGDANAMRWLGIVLSEAVADLGEMARRHPEIVRTWSRKQNVIPVLTGRNKGHRDELFTDLAAFAVGEDSPYRVNPKGKKVPDISTPANRLAGMLCDHLSHYRFSVEIMRPPVPTWARMASKLPELTADTWEDWADAAWECLLYASNDHPEAQPGLAKLGTRAARKDGLQTAPTRAANVKAEIRQTLREAIQKIAAPTCAYSE